MRRILAWTLTLAASASSTAFGQTAKAPARPVAPAPKAGAPTARPTAAPANPAAEAKARQEMALLLDEWEKQSKTVTSLVVVFDRIDISPKWGDQVYQGMAVLKAPDLACLEFKKAVPGPDGKPQYTKDAKGTKTLIVEKEPFERIVCTGKEVLQYEWDVKQIFVYPLDKESRQKALQQGPLPFLFNMKAAEAKQRYEMRLIQQNENAYKIEIIPREEIDKKSFSTAYVILNKTNFLPSQLVLFPVGDKERQDFTFRVIRPNEEIKGGYFQPATNMPGWKVVQNPGGEGQAAPAPGVGPVNRAPAAAGAAARPTTAAPKRVR